MSAHRTAWHFFFRILMQERGEPRMEVREEVPVADQPPRMDYLLLRNPESSGSCSSSGRSLRGLWPRLAQVAIFELKSVSHPYRPGDLDRLMGYLHFYHADDRRRPPRRDDLCAGLVVPARTPSLTTDVDSMGFRWEDLGGGYWRLVGSVFTTFVAEIDVVAEHEDDDVLRLFSHQPERTLEARQFWARMVGSKEAEMSLQDLEGYDDVLRKFIDKIPPAIRVDGLAPEERLAGLTDEQALLALPDSVLRTLPEDYIARQSEPVRSAIRQRLAR